MKRRSRSQRYLISLWVFLVAVLLMFVTDYFVYSPQLAEAFDYTYAMIAWVICTVVIFGPFEKSN
jgi:predicted membrane protein